MNETNTNGSSADCLDVYESTQYKVVAALRAGVGLFSFLCCLGVFLIIALYKKYRFFPQRLILYLTVAAAVHSISYTLGRVNYYSPRPLNDPYCYFGGLLNHYTAAVELLCIWCVTINLFANVVFNRRTTHLELGYFVVSYFAPILWFWIPLWQESYGTAGPWCGIRMFDDNCNEYQFGKWLVFGIWYIPLYISLTIIFFATIVVGVRVRRECRKWSALYDPQAEPRKALLRAEVKPLIWYPVVYLVLTLFSFVSQIYNFSRPDDPIPVLWYLRVLTSPLRGAFIALVYSVNAETRKQLKPSSMKAAMASCCRSDDIEEYDIMYSEFGDSIRDYSIKENDSKRLLMDPTSAAPKH